MLKQLLVIAAAISLSLTAQALTDEQKDAIVERIKPVGSLCLQGDATCGAAAPVSSGGTRSGEEVYKASCNACHGTGAAGAPKFGDSGAWAPRVSQGQDTLYTHAITGFKGMPPKGTCMTCSDDELKAAVDYMVKNSK